MNILPNLLNISKDLLLVTDRTGSSLEIGAHFQSLLGRQGVTPEQLNKIIRHALPALDQNGYIILPLDQYGIHTSPFSLLFKDTEKLILLAEDKTPDHRLTVLRKKTEQIHTLLDESSDPIFSFKEDGTYLYVNEIFAHTLGHNPEDIIGKKIWDIFPEDEANKRFAMVQKTFSDGETGNIEVKIPHPDGDKYFLTTVKPIKNEEKKVLFVICISKNITELRQTQNQLKTLRGTLPICANCKNIRDDKGYWNQIETYIDRHSEAKFSHGICPDCIKELYPDLASLFLEKD